MFGVALLLAHAFVADILKARVISD